MYIVVVEKDHYHDGNNVDCLCDEEYEYIITDICETLEDAQDIKKRCDACWLFAKPMIFHKIE